MKAVISGICGMDASYLAELLLGEGYTVIGFHRRSSQDKFDNIKHIMDHPNFKVEEGDLTDPQYINNLLQFNRPDVFFNAAAQSHVGTSFNQPHLTFEVNTKGVLNILEAIKNYSRKTRLVQFCTSEMWGHQVDKDGKQRETTPFLPRSPYGVSKLAAFDLCRTYRETYGLFACASICHNHTSPRRGDNFFEKKVVNWVVNNADILQAEGAIGHNENNIGFITPGFLEREKLRIGNIDSYRDFTHSSDCVRAIYMMSKMDEPKDYVIASGIATQMRDILQYAFSYFGKDYKEYIYIDPEFFRPADIDYLCGDSELIRTELGWAPQYSVEELVHEMIEDGLRKIGR